MASGISEELQKEVKALISHVTKIKEGSEKFTNLEKSVLTTCRKSDTMYFLNRKDIEKSVTAMCDKFKFHGFFKHADHLKQASDKYLDQNLTKSELSSRLNTIKFLLCMSQNPTEKFWKNPEDFNFIQEAEDEEDIDWGAYLNEGFETWSPAQDESSSDSSDETDITITNTQQITQPNFMIPQATKVEPYDIKALRQQLVSTVQNGWFNGEKVCMEPPSKWFDARVGILWEDHLKEQCKGLLHIEPVTFISEYKVMREVLWQMWGPHESTVFKIEVNKLVPKDDVSVASVRSVAFEKFMNEFVPYIETLDEFGRWYRSLWGEDTCETLRSYGESVQNLIRNIYSQLIDVEKKIIEQETTMTLLKMAQKFKIMFEPVKILQEIHLSVVPAEPQKPLKVALRILTYLRKSIGQSKNKLEQDIKLTLYLESLFYYFTQINSWLVKNLLCDHTGEFVISNKNGKNIQCLDAEMNFTLQDIIPEDDGMIRIISDQVLQIGRNLHLLRLLGKYDVIAKKQETIHQEFIRKVLEEMCVFYRCEIPTRTVKESPIKTQSHFELNGMGDWTNYVDVSDGFLMRAFEDFYNEQSDEKLQPELTLFEKIDGITTNLYPLQDLPERVFSEILTERFVISGLVVKNTLIENYSLDKQFEFLNHVFLFWDDFIFLFHHRLFQKMNTAKANWGNSIRLTSHLQDIIMDLYPNFYESCTVQVENYWQECRDSLEACSLINIKYEIKWPLSMVITEEHLNSYMDIFQFILKIKWALYTVNHLSLTDVEPKMKQSIICKRLRCLRFYIINSLNTINHYIFGLRIVQHRLRFELDFERANDLRSLIASHDRFVKDVHEMALQVRDVTSEQHGFNTLLKSVKMLKVMWNDVSLATIDNLEKCKGIYQLSQKALEPLVNPVYF